VRIVPSRICRVAASLAFLALLAPRLAWAGNSAKVCAEAAERAQVLRADGKLRKAREELFTCAREECPAAVARDCLQWAAELDAALPTIVPIARRGGEDVNGARVFVDGELVEGPSGRAVAVDPGAHTFRFELAGAKPVELHTVIHEAEKNRFLIANFETGEPKPTQASTSTSTSPSASAIPVGAWVAGGVTVAGLAGFTYFGLSGRSDLADLRSTCVDKCSPASVDDARRKLLIGDIFLGTGLIAAGVATWLILTRSNGSSKVARLDWTF
jgi:hypothetical protein